MPSVEMIIDQFCLSSLPHIRKGRLETWSTAVRRDATSTGEIDQGMLDVELLKTPYFYRFMFRSRPPTHYFRHNIEPHITLTPTLTLTLHVLDRNRYIQAALHFLDSLLQLVAVYRRSNVVLAISGVLQIVKTVTAISRDVQGNYSRDVHCNYRRDVHCNQSRRALQ